MSVCGVRRVALAVGFECCSVCVWVWVVVVCEAVKVVFGAAIVEAADPGQPR